MQVLINGAHSQLGKELTKLIPDAIALEPEDMDLCDRMSVRRFITRNHIGLIINCASYGSPYSLDKDSENAKKINFIGPRNLAKTGRKMIYISTNNVFDGRSAKPYLPTDEARPLSVFGQTKLMGEKAVLQFSHESVVIRTGWLYSYCGKNILKRIQKQASENSELEFASNIIGAPCYAPDLANAIIKIIPEMDRLNRGVYHFANSGICSEYDFASAVVKQLNLDCKLKPIPVFEETVPTNGALDTMKTTDVFGVKMENWQDALTRCINQMSR